jgi:hypothetical protein
MMAAITTTTMIAGVLRVHAGKTLAIRWDSVTEGGALNGRCAESWRSHLKKLAWASCMSRMNFAMGGNG